LIFFSGMSLLIGSCNEEANNGRHYHFKRFLQQRKRGVMDLTISVLP
jgi:hypothetical protein